MSNWVKLKIMPDTERVTLAHFDSSGVPDEADYVLATSGTSKEVVLKATDQTCDPVQEYSGTAPQSELYVGIRRGGVLEVHPISMFKIRPVVRQPEATAAQLLGAQIPMTFKEQMEEIKEKFGSRKTQRQLASKRKYAIEFGEEDVEEIELKTQKVAESTLEGSTSQTTLNDSIDILPHQNRDAICVEEVYDLNEIITENERSILMPLIDQMFDQISDQFIINLMPKSNDTEQKIIAIYIQLIIKLLNLKPSELRKVDPLPDINSEVKQFLFGRYLSIKPVKGNRCQYSISAKQKDRLLIYGLILCLILHNYRPMDLEVIQKAFKCQMRQFRKLVEIIGFYIESATNAMGINVKSIVFRVPLNKFTESKRSFRRK